MKNSYVLIILLMAAVFCLPQAASAQDYVGPEKCLQCHNNAGLGDMTGWRTSLHANGYSYVPDDAHTMENLTGVLNDFNENGVDDFHDGLDFNTVSSVFDQYKPNAPVLNYSAQDGYTVTVGSVTHRVYLTYGGSNDVWKQRYLVKINTGEGESNDYYVSPVQYNLATDAYAAYHPERWWDSNNAPVNFATRADASTHKSSLAKGCSGCHATGLELEQTVDGEWVMSAAGVQNEADYTDFNNIFDIDGDGDLDQINTACERCHGPGAEHATSGDKTKIINPANLTADQANNLCGMCHNRGKSLPNSTFGFPYDDANFTGWAVGDMVADIFSDGGGDWPDGKTSKKHRQQFLGFSESSKPTFEFHQVTCYECHDVHNTEKNHIRAELVEEDSLDAPITVATENDNNTLCLACHATHGPFEDIPVEWVADYANHVNDIAPIVSAHTKHLYDPTGTGSSRCSKCHMPKTSKSAIEYDGHSHAFEAISPEKTLFYQADGGMPNACAVSCHVKDGFPNFGIDLTGDAIGTWTEATDVELADSLMHYYGPGGVWWNTGFPMAVESLPGGELPQTYLLNQNYPNPFNPATNITFDVQKTGLAKLNVYNILGQKLATLVNESLGAGRYTVNFDASGLSSGVYIYKLEVNGFKESRKMVLTK